MCENTCKSTKEEDRQPRLDKWNTEFTKTLFVCLRSTDCAAYEHLLVVCILLEQKTKTGVLAESVWSSTTSFYCFVRCIYSVQRLMLLQCLLPRFWFVFMTLFRPGINISSDQSQVQVWTLRSDYSHHNGRWTGTHLSILFSQWHPLAHYSFTMNQTFLRFSVPICWFVYGLHIMIYRFF